MKDMKVGNKTCRRCSENEYVIVSEDEVAWELRCVSCGATQLVYKNWSTIRMGLEALGFKVVGDEEG